MPGDAVFSVTRPLLPDSRNGSSPFPGSSTPDPLLPLVPKTGSSSKAGPAPLLPSLLLVTPPRRTTTGPDPLEGAATGLSTPYGAAALVLAAVAVVAGDRGALGTTTGGEVASARRAGCEQQRRHGVAGEVRYEQQPRQRPHLERTLNVNIKGCELYVN